MAQKPWKLEFDENYRPSIAILVPVHNEEKIITLKLKNLSRVAYPAQKMETIIVNDASTDDTLKEISAFQASNPHLAISVFNHPEHLGKTKCMNLALKSVEADVIVVSDADCFWPSNILLKGLPYLSDSSVGAITARELLLNPQSSWVTTGEQFFDNTVQSIRIGESKIHSTIFFQGGFAAYKRVLLNEFDHEADDSGTALNIVQGNNRTLLIPEIGFFTPFPTMWRNKLTLKIRRASQLQRLWVRCLHFLVHGKLRMPKKIALPEIFLYIFNPLLFILLLAVSVLTFVQYPLFLAAFLLFLIPAFLIKRIRTTIIELIQNNCILLASLTSFVTNKGFGLWKPVQESRMFISEDALKQKNLI